jgi:pimeloyl-ACP methyl ester carboxylesterase
MDGSFRQADGGDLRIAESGDGRIVLCLHGEPRPTALHARLAERHRAIVVDVADAGSVDALAGAIATLGVDRFSVIGSASGTGLALSLAHRLVERIDALVLESPASFDDADLRPLAIPTLVLIGTRDASMPAEAARTWRERLGAHVVFVYGAGHAIGADRPDAVAHLVSDFLERREQFVVSREPGLRHP